MELNNNNNNNNEIFEYFIRSLLVVSAVESGWTVKKLSPKEFMFKKDRNRYLLEDINNSSEFMKILSEFKILN